jgi:pyruvate dehydrogenase E2 component (dihydrolipoamide acetyltransferase)
MASKVTMPKLSDTMQEGVIVKWLKKEGDKVQSGDVIAEIETDKANLEMEAYASGVLRKIIKKEGESAPVGELIAIIAEPQEDISDLLPGGEGPKTTKEAESPTPKRGVGEVEKPGEMVETEQEKRTQVKEVEEFGEPETIKEGEREKKRHLQVIMKGGRTDEMEAAKKPEVQSAEELTEMEGAPEHIKASPMARRMAKNLGLDLSQIKGSGPLGRVIKRDIEMFMERAEKVPAYEPERPPRLVPGKIEITPEVPVAAAPAEFEEKELSMMRKTIARRMAESKGPVPHFYITSEIDMGKAIEFRKLVNELEEDLKISFNDLIIKAVAKALMKYPQLNASFIGDKIRVYKGIHIGVAVALEDGLITPVIRNCEVKSLGQIAREAKDLAEKARSKKLKPEEYTGGTFTISNLGMYDVENFAAIINPPEGAILAVGSIQEKPVVVEGQIRIGHRMKVTLSCDHRVTDGATAAKFLQELKKILENPMTLAV